MNLHNRSVLFFRAYYVFILVLSLGLIASCQESSHQQMVKILAEEGKKNYNNFNVNCPEAQLAYCDSDLRTRTDQGDINFLNYVKASLLIKVGQEQKAVSIYQNLIDRMDPLVSAQMLPEAAIAYMRLGER